MNWSAIVAAALAICEETGEDFVDVLMELACADPSPVPASARAAARACGDADA